MTLAWRRSPSVPGASCSRLGSECASGPSTRATALTAREWQIARLVRDGLSNPEVGAQLFLSPRTVEWHLRNLFGKLGISSRKELAGALGDSESELIRA